MGPVSASLSAAGGAADVMTKDFPTLASMYQHATSLSAGSAQANAQRMQQDRQFNASLQNQQAATQGQFNEEDANRDTQAAMDQAHIQAAQQQQVQHAQLQAWLNGQEMTQQETMRLTQQKNAVADINSSSLLTDDEKQNAILKLKTHIDIGQQRLQQQQEKAKTEMMQNQSQLLASKVKDEEDAQDYSASKINDQMQFRPDATQQPKIETELDLTNPGLRQNNPAQFQAMVSKEMEARGLGQHWFKTRTGEMKMDPGEMEALKAKYAAQKSGAGKEGSGAAHDRTNQDSEAVLKSFHAWEAQQEKDGKTPTPEERAKKRDQFIEDHMAIADKLRNAGPAGEKKAREADIAQKAQEAHGVIDLDIQKVTQRTDLPPALKDMVIQNRLLQKKMLTEYKNYQSMPEGVKKRYTAIQEALGSLNYNANPGTVAPQAGGAPQATPGNPLAPATPRTATPGTADWWAWQGSPAMLASGGSNHEGNILKFMDTVENLRGTVPDYAKDKSGYLRSIRNAELKSIGEKSGPGMEAEIRRRLKEKGIALE